MSSPSSFKEPSISAFVPALAGADNFHSMSTSLNSLSRSRYNILPGFYYSVLKHLHADNVICGSLQESMHFLPGPRKHAC
ncbi:unnamed protein product [Penicillium camemberti]|uniref:Str. FM013 n=1 Tax=Penicillium camemberti (strain FM 013) TaxID=1429867 RepID=A0A0G4PY56_PENC3|nr:unnamed protein product [Penicillium camemberti]